MKLSYLTFDGNLYEEIRSFCSSSVTNQEISETVRDILQEVSRKGDTAVLEKTLLYDGAKILQEELAVSATEISDSLDALQPHELDALAAARKNITDFHQKSLPQDWEGSNGHGAFYGEKHYPINRVGLYVPGGNVPLVSTVLMTAILAKVAKVPEIAVATPPNQEGRISPKLLGALKFCGITEVYKVGGAQAIAALAYGTETIPAVDKIFGPGNAYVNEAKRQVFGTVGVDLLPGPSEVMVIADETANPKYAAAALLAQAEHGSGKEKVYLLFSSLDFFDHTVDELGRQIRSLTHKAPIERVFQNGFKAIHLEDENKMAEVANFVAPEHLELQVAEQKIDFFVENVKTAGALLLGHHSATALGDFVAGPSHVLPTGRSSRFSSGLRISDFFRRSSFIKYDADSLLRADKHVQCFAQMENLDGHGASVQIRASSGE